MDYILQYSIYVLIVSVLMGLSTWKLFKIMGYNPLFAFVPFYNYLIIQKETKHPKWWVAIAYFPIVGPIMMSVFHVFLMKKFGKTGPVNALLTVILPFIFMATVNYSKNPEIEEEGIDEEGKKKETFIGSVTFAVVFATIIHVFITQPFGIPTGSMERTLLVGDFLFVNKLNYGYRMPMRPVALPFLQGTIFDTGQKGNPKDDPKSYVEAVKLPYLRLPGWEKPEKNDIVVFNYPDDSVHIATDRKDPYVKRLVAVGGDVVEFRAGRLFINGKPEFVKGDQEVQHKYIVRSASQLDIPGLYKTFGFLPVVEGQDDKGFVYQFQGLTDKIRDEIKQIPGVESVDEDVMKQGLASLAYYKYATDATGNYMRDANGYPVPASRIDSTNSIFPVNKPWNQDWYGPLTIPKKGDVINLTQDNYPEYQRLIGVYEHNKLENKNGKFFINGKETNQYTVQQDYYFMIGDNRDASLDARFFGFVPEENLVGKPMFTWMSVQGLFPDANSTYQAEKKIRWDRMFKATNTGEANKTSYWWVAALILVVFFGWDYIMKLFRKKKEDE
ncbi:signal peptidase I [Soonwooa sp.]|uniref:signal peptidase I n=2 Tax=Soonwooa sp. TaxID=1938592 RepID=UPI0028AEEB81|nr:signal peptidase I [Soonwooa sp.]